MSTATELIQRCIRKLTKRDAKEPTFEPVYIRNPPLKSADATPQNLASRSPDQKTMQEVINSADEVPVLAAKTSGTESKKDERDFVSGLGLTVPYMQMRNAVVSSMVVKGGNGSTVYEDRENRVRLEISHWSLEDPVVATLGYMDRFGNARKIELLGRPVAEI